jgi:hypothetical protein
MYILGYIDISVGLFYLTRGFTADYDVRSKLMVMQ